jgi:hypothetical protein
LTESLPKKLKGLLPSPEELEAELSKKDKDRKRRGVIYGVLNNAA